ncbi:MAG: hypothetical protein L3J98_08385 [Gammaproteobacteria bacterium]|nr:hypothetical protein [Gammaproteobacteria bacterium]
MAYVKQQLPVSHQSSVTSLSKKDGQDECELNAKKFVLRIIGYLTQRAQRKTLKNFAPSASLRPLRL